MTDVRAITPEQFDSLSGAYQDFAPANEAFNSEQDRADSLDGMLNDVYAAVRLILPAERFAKVKSEQTQWLKQRDAAPTLQAKNALVEARIGALQDYLW